jgi:hypothetical protein
MSDIDISQAEADKLLAMEKHRVSDDFKIFPMPGDGLVLPLTSVDKREAFLLDINRRSIDLAKVSYQNRARQAIILVRLDLGSRPHRNPDGVDVGSPHLHLYREGYAHKWAIPAPADKFPRLSDMQDCLDDFMTYCNITKPPRIQKGLFS